MNIPVVKFELHLPLPALRPFVKHLIVSETVDPGAYCVLPGLSVVVGFQYRGQLSYLVDDTKHPLSLSGVTGLRDRYRVFQNTANIGSILVVFQEGGAEAFFPVPVHELYNESISMDLLFPASDLAEIEEKLSQEQTDAMRLRLVEQFLMKRLRPISRDELVKKAISEIHASKGTLRIKDLAARLCISQSPLEKRFRRVVGASPKKYASVVRLRSVLDSPLFYVKPAEAGLEAGYFDQAHFIKEFKAFAGQTPEQFRSRPLL